MEPRDVVAIMAATIYSGIRVSAGVARFDDTSARKTAFDTAKSMYEEWIKQNWEPDEPSRPEPAPPNPAEEEMPF